MIGKGAPWGDPFDPDLAIPVVEVQGEDADLARSARAEPDAVFRFTPSAASDLGRALGLGATTPSATVVACDRLDLGPSPDAASAVNAVVFGVAPHRLGWWRRRHRVQVEVDGRVLPVTQATTVVVASGQFLRGADLVPRGHPGDGRCEVQVYDVAPAHRRGMRARLAGGTHVPNPRIVESRGRTVVVRWARGRRPVEVDGRPVPPRSEARVTLVPGAVRVLI